MTLSGGDVLQTLPVWFMVLAGTVLGAIWGSFIAALCSRWPKGESIMHGRSRCDRCGTAIAARDLVPVASFLMLKGRCRHCGEPIGRDTISIELIAAAIGGVAFLLFTPSAAFALSIFGWLLLPLAILDARHLWLPDRLTLLLAIAALPAAPLLGSPTTLTDRLIGGIAGFAVLEGIRRSYRMFRGQEGMGAGDPKLLGALGLWLGWQMLPLTLLTASGIGLAAALVMRGTMKAFPLGTYLALAGFVVACSGVGR